MVSQILDLDFIRLLVGWLDFLGDASVAERLRDFACHQKVITFSYDNHDPKAVDFQFSSYKHDNRPILLPRWP